MTPLEIAQQRIDECRATRSTKLDLSGLGLESIPDEVFELTWLEKLDISGHFEIGLNGGIKKISYEIKRLTSLKKFDCTLNIINDITPLNKLTTLTKLGCGYNQINDITTLNKLTKLTKLDCSNVLVKCHLTH